MKPTNATRPQSLLLKGSVGTLVLIALFGVAASVAKCTFSADQTTSSSDDEGNRAKRLCALKPVTGNQVGQTLSHKVGMDRYDYARYDDGSVRGTITEIAADKTENVIGSYSISSDNVVMLTLKNTLGSDQTYVVLVEKNRSKVVECTSQTLFSTIGTKADVKTPAEIAVHLATAQTPSTIRALQQKYGTHEVR